MASGTAECVGSTPTGDGESWNVGTRILGGLKAVGGGVEAAAGGALCTTGIGCVIGAALLIHGADVAQAGTNQAISGEHTPTLTNQGLQSLGMSESTADIVEGSASFAGITRSIAVQSTEAAVSMARLPTAGATEAVVDKSLSFSTNQLQHAFKHAKDFGISGSWNKANGQAFMNAVQAHIDDAATVVIQGTYRGNAATHFYNPNTGLNVIRGADNAFVSGWRLSAQQTQHVLTTGRLGGG